MATYYEKNHRYQTVYTECLYWGDKLIVNMPEGAVNTEILTYEKDGKPTMVQVKYPCWIEVH